MEIIIKIGQLLLSLSILIVLHEMGHFLFARLFKTRVEKFYLFFDAGFSLFKIKKGDTEYGIGWLPLGGYVKISGMIDESMDKEAMKKPPQPYEFRSKPAWNRLLIMLGGVIVNLILGFLIYTFILFMWGEKYLPNENITDGIMVTDTIVGKIGLLDGDKIVSINGNVPKSYSDAQNEIIYPGEMVVNRGGQNISLKIPEDMAGQLSDPKRQRGFLFYPRIPFIISKIPDTCINKESGIQVKDMVVAVNGYNIKYYDEFPGIVDTLKNQTIVLGIVRNEQRHDISVQIDANGKIGVESGGLSLSQLEKLGFYKLETIKYGFFESIPAGFKLAISTVQGYLKQLKLIFNFKSGAHKGLGGFAAIGNLFPPVWDWQSFWQITAFLSIMLAVLNLLPIPALDGGHVTFLLYEMITGRKPGEKFLEYAQIVGMILLLALLLYANGNDVYRWIINKFF